MRLKQITKQGGGNGSHLGYSDVVSTLIPRYLASIAFGIEALLIGPVGLWGTAVPTG